MLGDGGAFLNVLVGNKVAQAREEIGKDIDRRDGTAGDASAEAPQKRMRGPSIRAETLRKPAKDEKAAPAK
jgi:hypothetical protein